MSQVNYILLKYFLVKLYFAGIVPNNNPLDRPTSNGFFSKKVLTDPVLIAKIADAFNKINKDSTADSLAAAKASRVAKLRR